MADVVGGNARVDDSDLAFAVRELGAARAMLFEAHGIGDRRTRAEAIRVAAAKLALASRAIDVVVDRRAD